MRVRTLTPVRLLSRLLAVRITPAGILIREGRTIPARPIPVAGILEGILAVATVVAAGTEAHLRGDICFTAIRNMPLPWSLFFIGCCLSIKISLLAELKI